MPAKRKAKRNAKERTFNPRQMNVKQLSQCLGVTQRRVRQLAEEGIVVKTGHGEYDGTESIKNYHQPKLDSPIANAQLEGLRLDNEKKQRELDQDRRNLVPASDYLVVLEAAITRLSRALAVLPDDVNRARKNAATEDELKEINKVVSTCQNSLQVLLKNKGREPALDTEMS